MAFDVAYANANAMLMLITNAPLRKTVNIILKSVCSEKVLQTTPTKGH